MSRKRSIHLPVVIGLAALSLPLTQTWAADLLERAVVRKALTLEQFHTKHLPMITRALASTQEAANMNHKDEALAELQKIEDMMAILNKALSQKVKPTFSNRVCPIMESKIYPADVPAGLSREFDSEKVAFCCTGCPSQWDTLSDVTKRSKLIIAKRPASHRTVYTSVRRTARQKMMANMKRHRRHMNAKKTKPTQQQKQQQKHQHQH